MKLTLENGHIKRDGVSMFALVRAIWGEGAPSHCELSEAEKYLGALIAEDAFKKLERSYDAYLLELAESEGMIAR